jgi:hypothetical protein
MASPITIKGAAKIVKFYNLTRLEIEGIDFDNYDLESKEDIRELFELVNDFVETGEADAIETPLEIQEVDAEECSIVVDGKTYYVDELVLNNRDIVDVLSDIQEAEVGDIYYVRSLEGEGVWDIDHDIEDEIDISKLSVDYIDCSVFFDQYDVLREGYLDILCDTIIPENLSYEDATFELLDFYFDPVQVYGQLYKVVEEDGVKILHRIDYGGRMLAGTDFIVDDFEEN